MEQGARVVNLSKLNDTLIDATELSKNKQFHLKRCADKWDNEIVGGRNQDDRALKRKDSKEGLKRKDSFTKTTKRDADNSRTVHFDDEDVKVTKHKKPPNPNFKPKDRNGESSKSDGTDFNYSRSDSKEIV